MESQAARLRTTLSSRYTIEQELGSGGMATVYLAYDRKHERQVAIKALRPELAAALGSERFLREIKITANLNHPHILPLLDSGEAGGVLFYVMPYVEGETLRDRLNREERLPIDEALSLASEIADALGSAHRGHVIHRDIKPENILLREGHAVVADFGIALAVAASFEERLTETGLSPGTPSYMSPEQIDGTGFDARSDIYALGALLFEMLTGRPPFEGPTPLAVAVQHQTAPPPDPRVVNPEIPESVAQLILKCLAKDRNERYQTAADVHAELERVRHPVAEAVGAINLRWLLSRLRRPVVAIPTALAVLALAWFSVWFVQRRAEIRWAREVALPEIERVISENDVWRNLVAPYRLAEEAEAILGDDPELAELFAEVSREIDVVTEPSGASIYMKEYESPDAEWTYLGVTPLEDVRVPIGIFRWRIEKEGYEPVLAAASTWDVGGEEDIIGAYELVRTLDEEGSVPPGMVRVGATETPAGTLPDFFIGRYEVTNREYKEFVDAGGYRNREYWKHPFVRDGRELTWDEATGEFVDGSGLPGPSTWQGGDYPQGQGDHPVSGVSWYESAAYAEYAGMSLPTATHWNAARGGYTPMILFPQLGGFAVLAPFSNFEGAGAVPIGSLAGFTAYGAYDMAGNVREWCWNESAVGKVVRGGAWGDNTYMFEDAWQAPAIDRSPKNGIRLALYPDDAGTVPQAAFGVQSIPASVYVRSYSPVSDAIFEVYREQFAYDRTELNARLEYREESPGGWIREKVSFDAAYGGERVLAYLFLPADVSPPYQTVIYFPGGASTWMPSSEELESYYEFPMFLSYLVRSGRAVLYPVYKGTFERGSQELSILSDGAETYAYTEFVIQLVKDFRRSIDYLETRQDIDGGKLAYYGMSWGAWLGPIITAVEERMSASVLVGGGLTGIGRPEVRDFNYVTRVTMPTLMLNGRYDVFFPLETSSQPLHDLLGTPPEDKQLLLYDTDHVPPRDEYIKETLAWLDRYLGPVSR
ncbi:MAG: protein kinase [Gemmatimonadota bacterium]|nr:MAG: protein kinase [Gemmatimonadota bacterium]